MKIVIELPTWLGDSVMVSPALINLLELFPDSELIFIGSHTSINLYKDHPKCSKTFVLQKRMLSIYRIVNLIGRCDIYITFRSTLRSKILKFFMFADSKYQYSNKNFKSKHFHQVEKYNHFINESINRKKIPKSLEIYKNIKLKKISDKKVIGINPGAAYGDAKCWPAKKYIDLIGLLVDKYHIVLIGGKDDKIVSQKILPSLDNQKKSKILNYTGLTSIDELCNLIASFDLLVTGDSGPMHIAAALKIPSIAIFGPTNFHETSQWQNEKSVIIRQNLVCQPCMKRTCKFKHHDCMELIEVNKVYKELETLIN